LSAPAVLAVDPAQRTGIAMLFGDRIWCHTLKLRRVPPKAVDLALVLADLAPRMPWHEAPAWHLVVERMYGGGNAATSIISAQTAGQLYQELARMREFASEAFPYASQWRSVLHAQGRINRARAKATAIELVERRFGVTVDDNAAEAVCMALWRREDLEHEARRVALGLDLPRNGKPRPRKRARVTEAEVLALVAERDERR